MIKRDVYEKFLTDLKDRKDCEKRCMKDLFEIKKDKLYLRWGYKNIYDFAEKVGGLSREKVRSDMWILNVGNKYPEIMKVIDRKGLNSVRPVLAMINDRNVGFWAKKADSMSVKALKIYVRGLRNVSQVSMNLSVSKSTLDRIKELKGAKSWDDFFSDILSDEVVVEDEVRVVKNASRAVPKDIKRVVVNRSGGMCAVSGCGAEMEVIHHVDRYSEYKTHDAKRMHALCDAHHELIHLGLMDESDWYLRRYEKRGKVEELIQVYRK
jgi:hypothetical protein